MTYADAVGVFAGAVALGFVHGVEPGHGWPVAAAYAMDRGNKWLYGLVAGLIIGLGHLVSSLAVVGAFYVLKQYVPLAGLREPVWVAGVEIGSPLGIVAGLLLVVLGVREYVGGHSHSHSHGGAASHDPEDARARDGAHAHDYAHDNGVRAALIAGLPFVGDGDQGHDHGHGHAHLSGDEAVEGGLWGLATFAFLLGFVHEEEFEMIALCTGSSYCLELMVAYALAVIVGLVGLTLLLVAGYTRYEDRAERYAEYLPALSAAVLILMGLGFVLGLL